MGSIRVHEFITLDGVFEDPSFTMPYGFTDEMGAELGGLTGPATAILLGRSTFEMFAPAWRDRSSEDDPGADFFNGTTKHVVSSTLTSEQAESTWAHSTVLSYDADAIRALAAEGDVYVSGSGQLVRALLAEGLVDELHLLTYPVVLGSGARLFPEGTGQLPLSLVRTQTFDNGVVQLVYGPANS